MPFPARMTSAQQYAVLPWRHTQQLEILLITSRETRRWVVPKGWPMNGRSNSESAAQEAFEEAGIKGSTWDAPLGFFEYQKRGRGQLRVDVFAMKVTQVLDQWPEAHERKRQWFSPAEAAKLVDEPQLAALIRGFAGDQSERAPPTPTYLQAAWQRLKALLHPGAAQ